VAEEVAAGVRRGEVHALPAGAERLPAHRPRQSICLNFGLAEEYGGRCHLRFDDTNPDQGGAVEYIEAIKEDIRWLGFDWGEHEYLRLRLLRAALRVGVAAHPRRARPTSTT
jgi:glutaminyl-tRNA synthetase